MAGIPGVPGMPLAQLGGSGITVSRMALGSWRTYERMTREQGVAVMRAAREAGVTFLDDARYNDETGTAPVPTGYSEVVFGEVFRGTGWPRADAVISNKLWWEFWPGESPGQELAGSLRRMGLDYIDLIYSVPPPEGVPLAEAVEMIAGLVTAGMARAWGTIFWPPGLMEQAWLVTERAGLPGPCACQPAYSLVQRTEVETLEMDRLTRTRPVAIVASFVLAGGVLTGKYDANPEAGRAAGSLGRPEVSAAAAAGRELAALAAETGRDPAALAMAFALLNPVVTTVLFGATRPWQVTANLAALAVAGELTPADTARLTRIGTLA